MRLVASNAELSSERISHTIVQAACCLGWATKLHPLHLPCNVQYLGGLRGFVEEPHAALGLEQWCGDPLARSHRTLRCSLFSSSILLGAPEPLRHALAILSCRRNLQQMSSSAWSLWEDMRSVAADTTSPASNLTESICCRHCSGTCSRA